MVALFLASCGGGGKDVEANPTPARDPAFIKADSEGEFRAVDGTKLVSLEHESPYRWTATLSFSGDSRPIIARLAVHLLDLDFTLPTDDLTRVEGGKVTGCDEGEIDASGNGRCMFHAYLYRGGGDAELTVDKPNSERDGKVTIVRTYEHRLAGDRLGPPYPPAQPTGKSTVHVPPRNR